MSLPMDTLENRSEQASGDLRGWLELALLYRDPQADIDNQVQRLSQWREQWPNHPAALQLPEMVGALRKAARQRPQRVAVLLPESGNLAPAAEAIRDGMMTGYYSAEEAGNPTPDLRFYDVSNADVSAVFQRAVEDGAQFVVGPLAKEQVTELAARGAPPVTVLALNYLDQGSRDAPLFQFGLAPEDEARQVARQAWREGHRQVGVLYPESDWGRRVSGAFMNAWRERGGEVSLESAFTDENMGDTVRNLMEAARERLATAGHPAPVLRQRHGKLLDAVRELDDQTRLLVIGKQGTEHAGVDRIGDNVEKLIRGVERSVLLAVGPFREPAALMLAYDNSPSMRDGVRLIASSPLLRELPCHLVQVNGSDRDREGADWAAGRLEENGHPVTVASLKGDVEAELHRYQEEHDLDLVVMGAYGHSRIREFLIGSTTDRLIRHARVPHLILR